MLKWDKKIYGIIKEIGADQKSRYESGYLQTGVILNFSAVLFGAYHKKRSQTFQPNLTAISF